VQQIRKGASMRLEWLTEHTQVDETANFFQANIDPAYISHSELMWGRAISPSEWAPNLAGVLRREFAERACEAGDANKRVARCLVDEALVGVALVEFQGEAPIPFGVLEDIVIARSARGKGFGDKFLVWIIEQMKRKGLRRAYLESGVANDGAHHWFNRHGGFHQVSIVMMADIDEQ
jgi:GNAT superfamily N-acetyltransferase